MWGSAGDPEAWKAKRDKMCREWTFATSALADLYGLHSHSPYTEPSFVEWALSSTGRPDCIGARPIKLTLHGEALEHETGKIVLREAFETCASWRRKDPIEVGSGITVIGHDPFWADLISDEELTRQTTELLSRGFVLQSKEHLANFRAFEAAFGLDGAGHPTKARLGLGEGCAGCCFEIGEATWCSVCGAYPAQRKATLP